MTYTKMRTMTKGEILKISWIVEKLNEEEPTNPEWRDNNTSSFKGNNRIEVFN